DWQPTPLTGAVQETGGTMLLIGEFGENDALTDALSSALTNRTTSFQTVAASDEDGLRSAITRNDLTWDDIVVVSPSRGVDESLPEQGRLELAQARTLQLAEIVKTISRMGARNSPRLWLVTRGAQQVDPDEDVTLAQTSLRGLARVLTFEHPELNTTIVDIDAQGIGSAEA